VSEFREFETPDELMKSYLPTKYIIAQYAHSRLLNDMKNFRVLKKLSEFGESQQDVRHL